MIKITEPRPKISLEDEQSSDDSETDTTIKDSLTNKLIQNLSKRISICLEPGLENIPKTPPCVGVPQFVEKRDVTYEIVRKMSEELDVIVDSNSPQMVNNDNNNDYSDIGIFISCKNILKKILLTVSCFHFPQRY